MSDQYKYLIDNPDYPYCPGCGHTQIVKALDSALKKTGKDPKQINMVTDIGCVGLVDRLFLTNTIHTTHGRSTAVATGVQLANDILFDTDVIHIVMIGDGGATIGLAHLIEAAKMNVNITVILHNNFVYGMTGGQHSGLTPENFRTATTQSGNLQPPLKIGELLQAAHSGFFARKLAVDRDLDEEILKAINYNGFALVEIIELCTGYATKWNKMTKKDIQKILENMNSDKLGTIIERTDRESFGSLYKENFPRKDFVETSKTIEVKSKIEKEMTLSIILSGSAGEGAQTAAGLLCQTAVANGLNVQQQNDNPITIGTGFSISEFIFSTEEIYYASIDSPDYIVITSEDGFKRVKEIVEDLEDNSLLLIDNELSIGETRAKVIQRPFRKTAKNKKLANLVALGYLLKYTKEIPIQSFTNSIQNWGINTENSIEAVKIGYEME